MAAVVTLCQAESQINFDFSLHLLLDTFTQLGGERKKRKDFLTVVCLFVVFVRRQMFRSRAPSSHFMERYEKICRMGEGSYGVVYKCRNRETGQVSRFFT